MSTFLSSRLDIDCKVLFVGISNSYINILRNSGPSIKKIQSSNYNDLISELNNGVDIIISDINLEGNKTALDLALELRLKDLNTQVIILTSNPDPEMTIKAIQYDVYDYLISPITKDALLRSVSRAMEKKRLLDEKDNLEKSLKDFQEKVSNIINMKRKVTELDTKLLNVALDFEESRKLSSNQFKKLTKGLKEAIKSTKQSNGEEK